MYITLAGFPRSGNTFLRYALFNMYPEVYFNRPIHTVKFLEEYQYNDKIVMPIRKPEDCIASWIELKSIIINEQAFENKKVAYDIANVENAIKYYIRYFSYVLQKSDNFLFLDFEYFKNDLTYVDKKIKNAFKIKAIDGISIGFVKNILIEKEAFTQIPREDKTVLNMIKSNVQNNDMIKEANSIYDNIKKIMESNNV